MAVIAVTVCNVEDVVHAGGLPNSRTALIQLEDHQVPDILKRFIANRQAVETRRANGHQAWSYEAVTFSLVEE